MTKKWITTTKRIEIPVKYEEILINDKDLDSYNEQEITEIFSKIKHKITDAFSHHEKDKNDEDQQHHSHQHQSSDIVIKKYDEKSNKKESDSQSEFSEKLIPFSLNGEGNEDISTKKKENIIPLWGEEITINKKMVKLGEIIIRKYQTSEKQKIDVDIKKEKISIKYPENHKEEIIS